MLFRQFRQLTWVLDEVLLVDRGIPQLNLASGTDQHRILVHLRMNTRTDVDGNKVLFLEEIQSDWGQQGKKEGFDSKAEQRKELEKRGVA